MTHQTVSLIIPTWNEEENLRMLLPQLPDLIDEILVVDRHSADDTVEVAKEHGCKVLYDSIGKGSALIKGAKMASGDFIIMMDADLSHRAEEIRNLYDKLNDGYDVVMGSRFMEGGGSDDITVFRRLGNKFFVHLVNLLFGSSYTDLCYGYRAFTKDAFNRMSLSSNGFAIETEITIKAIKKGFKVIEVPSFEKVRGHGTTNLRAFKDGFKILALIIKEVFSG